MTAPRRRKTAIRSMTGYGKGSEKCHHGKIVAEIKTLNHKTLSITCNPFNGIFLLEQKVAKILEKEIFRGKVFVNITREDSGKGEAFQGIKINEKIVREYLRRIKKVQKNLGINGEVQIWEVLGFPGVLEDSSGKSGEDHWPYIEKAVKKALAKLVAYRASEGAHIAAVFGGHTQKIKSSTRQIKKYSRESVKAFKVRMVQVIKDIFEAYEPDKSRVESEVASFAKNSDVTEEINRLEAHLAAYRDAMMSGKAGVGKKLDFIAQEMQREANTIGAKSSDIRISRAVIEMKSEIEKIREQIKNVE